MPTSWDLNLPVLNNILQISAKPEITRFKVEDSDSLYHRDSDSFHRDSDSFHRDSDSLYHRDTTRGLLATDHVILNHGQVTWTTPELAPPLLTTTPHQREDVSALDRFSVHRCPTRRVFSGTGFESVTKQATVQYLYHSATAASRDTEFKI
ncbi:uncharacterized protein TNCV_940321 [Trichonephila clavipes]|nr:uncharacterized protein TNCV_940321 [Trichonephila clavipes]